MLEFSFPKAALIVFLSIALSTSGLAQIYTPPPTTTAPPPTTAAPPPATTAPSPTATTPTPTTTTTTPTAAAPPATTTSAGTTTSTPSTTAGSTAVASSSSGVPGYTSPSGGYGPGRTIAYVIAPFAVVAATYFIGHHHQIEIHPNAGFVWPRHVDFADTTAHLRDEGMYGLKAAVPLNDHVQVEGNFAYMNHFESRLAPTILDQAFGIQPRTIYGLLYDVNGLWNFGAKPIFGTRFTPYATAGIGGLSTEVRHANSALIAGQFYRTDPATGTAVLNPTRTVI